MKNNSIKIVDVKEQMRKEIISEFMLENGRKGWSAQKKNYSDLKSEMTRRMKLGKEKQAQKLREYWSAVKSGKLKRKKWTRAIDNTNE